MVVSEGLACFFNEKRIQSMKMVILLKASCLMAMIKKINK